MDFKIYTSTDSEGFVRLYELFRTVFADPDETEDLDGIQASLSLVGDPQLVRTYGDFREYWVAAIEDGRPVGGVNFTAFELPSLGITTAHINYLFVAPDSRGLGLGSSLLEQVRVISRPDFIFCEQNDPSLMNREELEEDMRSSGISPQERIGWWTRRGFGRLEFRYVQPPLSPDKAPAEGMSLNVCPSDSPLDAKVVEAHLRRFFYISVLKKSAGTDAYVESLLGDVLRRSFISLSLNPIISES